MYLKMISWAIFPIPNTPIGQKIIVLIHKALELFVNKYHFIL